MGITALMALFSIGSALISGGTQIAGGIMNKRENEKARAEARSLAEISRKDDLQRNTNNNMLAAKGLEMGKDKLNLSRTLTNSSIREKQLDKQSMIGTANQSTIENTADSLLDPKRGLALNRKRFI